jgi:hypothetical protein
MYFVPLLVAVVFAAEPDVVVKDITLKKAEYDSFAEVLHITQKSGTIDLSDAVSAAAYIEIDMYRKGKKLPTVLKGLGSSDSTSDRIRFALNVVDMDYLTLGDGKKQHCRLHFKVGVGKVGASSTFDVPKKECEFSKLTLVNDFGIKEGDGNRIPVCWMIDTNTASRITAGTPEEIVKANPKADMAIVYIRIER